MSTNIVERNARLSAVVSDILADQAPAVPVQMPGRIPVDIEDFLQWAVARTGRLPWRRDDYRALTLNPYSARPRRRPVTSWTLAVACASTHVRFGAGQPIEIAPGPDAALVLQAIASLGDPALSEIVRSCARARIRLDWMPGVTPRRVERQRFGKYRNGNRRGRARVVMVWEPCAPDQVAAARAVYRRWHQALTRLAATLDGELEQGQVAGFAAPAAPWKPKIAKKGLHEAKITHHSAPKHCPPGTIPQRALPLRGRGEPCAAAG